MKVIEENSGTSSLRGGDRCISRLAILLGSMMGISLSAFGSIDRLQITASKSPELYWLESDSNSIYRCVDVVEGRRLVFLTFNQAKGIVSLKHCNEQQLTIPGSKFIDVAVDGEQVYAIDEKTNTILELIHDRSQFSWKPLSNEAILSEPRALAASDKAIYVFDGKSRSLKVLQSGQLIQEVALTDHVLDRLVASDREVVGLDRAGKMIVRFVLGRGTNDKSAKRIVAVETTNIPDLLGPVDLAHKGAVYYILDRERKQLAIWSPQGGDVGYASYSDLATDPTAITSEGERLVFADQATHSFRVAYYLDPVGVIFSSDHAADGLSSLYGALLRQKLLPEQSYVVQPDDNLSKVTQTLGIFPTGYSDEFSKVFCELNKTSCQRGVVTLEPGSTIRLPNLPLRTYLGKGSVRQATSASSNPCASINTGNSRTALTQPLCEEKMNEYNPNLVTKPNSAVPRIGQESAATGIVVPEIIVRTSVIVSSSEKALSTFESDLKGKATLFAIGERIASMTVQDDEQLPASAPPVLIPTVPPKYFASIHQKIPGPVLPAITVAVVDTASSPINANHAEFISEGTSRVSGCVPSGANPTSTFVPVSPVEAAVGPRVAQPWDHATLTAALLAGNQVGVDPSAKILYVKLGDFQSCVSEQRARIFNLSLGEKEYLTHASAEGGIADIIEEYKSVVTAENNYQTLFVIAAGNDNKQVDPNSLAGTGASSNVIVVGGSDSSDPPRLWAPVPNHTGSDISFEFVHVMSPAEQIEGATLDGSYARASGTSLSAAIVSGLASELMATNSSWLPYKIKERIVATSDVEPWSGNVYSTGGTINADLALQDSSWDVATFTDRQKGELVTCRGTLGQDAENSAITLIDPTNQKTVIQVSDIKRIHQDSYGAVTVIFEQSINNKRLSRIPGFSLEISRYPFPVPISQLSGVKLSWTPEAHGKCDGMNVLPISQVTDFIARMQ